MKKLKNPVFLETVRYSLSDTDVDLINLELKEIEESAQPTVFKCRINAIHAGTTKNFHTYPLEELEKSAVKWTKPYGKPILKNHNMEEEPLGRIQEASVIKYGNNEGVLSVVAAIPDKQAAEKIRDQRYVTVSVGVASKNVTCSVCGVNWYQGECEHDVGKVYPKEAGGETLCSATIKDIQPVELSFVNLPADADESRFAGVVTFGESEDFEFFSESSTGVAKTGQKKTSDEESDDIALAVKETWQDFLSQLNLQGEDTHTMDEETKTQETVLEEEAKETEDEVTNTEQELDGDSTEAISEETSDGESTEEEAASDEAPVTEESTPVEELANLGEYLSDDEEAVEETEEAVTETEDDSELLKRVKELEDEVSRLKQNLTDQESAAAETAKNVRGILARHIVDLKVVLNQASLESLAELEEEESASTIKELVAKLKGLRKELKESDYKVFGVATPQLTSETLPNSEVTPESPETSISEASEETAAPEMSEAEIIRVMTEQLSQSRPYKRKGQ